MDNQKVSQCLLFAEESVKEHGYVPAKALTFAECCRKKLKIVWKGLFYQKGHVNITYGSTNYINIIHLQISS